jgi:hypothetical protein
VVYIGSWLGTVQGCLVSKKKTEANIIEALASDEIIQKCLELGTSGKTVTTS